MSIETTLTLLVAAGILILAVLLRVLAMIPVWLFRKLAPERVSAEWPATQGVDLQGLRERVVTFGEALLVDVLSLLVTVARAVFVVGRSVWQVLGWCGTVIARAAAYGWAMMKPVVVGTGRNVRNAIERGWSVGRPALMRSRRTLIREVTHILGVTLLVLQRGAMFLNRTMIDAGEVFFDRLHHWAAMSPAFSFLSSASIADEVIWREVREPLMTEPRVVKRRAIRRVIALRRPVLLSFLVWLPPFWVTTM